MYLFFIVFTFIHNNETESKIAKLNLSIQKLVREGCCIEQVHESGNAFVAIKNRKASCRMWIKTFDNETLFYEYSKKPIHLLSGGIGGFSWLKSSNPNKIYCYRLNTAKKYKWLLEKVRALDCKLYEKGEAIYYEHLYIEEDNSQYGLLLCQGNELRWKTILAASSVQFLNDSFSRHQFTNKTNNHLLINKNHKSSALLLSEYTMAEVFGNHHLFEANTAAVDHTRENICIRHNNFFMIYNLKNKKNTVFKVSPIEINNLDNNATDEIKHFLFSQCDTYVLVFLSNYLFAYDIEKNECTKIELPQQFKAIHQLKSPLAYIFHSMVDKLYLLKTDAKSIKFTKIDSQLYSFFCN